MNKQQTGIAALLSTALLIRLYQTGRINENDTMDVNGTKIDPIQLITAGYCASVDYQSTSEIDLSSPLKDMEDFLNEYLEDGWKEIALEVEL